MDRQQEAFEHGNRRPMSISSSSSDNNSQIMNNPARYNVHQQQQEEPREVFNWLQSFSSQGPGNWKAGNNNRSSSPVIISSDSDDTTTNPPVRSSLLRSTRRLPHPSQQSPILVSLRNGEKPKLRPSRRFQPQQHGQDSANDSSSNTNMFSPRRAKRGLHASVRRTTIVSRYPTTPSPPGSAPNSKRLATKITAATAATVARERSSSRNTTPTPPFIPSSPVSSLSRRTATPLLRLFASLLLFLGAMLLLAIIVHAASSFAAADPMARPYACLPADAGLLSQLGARWVFAVRSFMALRPC